MCMFACVCKLSAADNANQGGPNTPLMTTNCDTSPVLTMYLCSERHIIAA